MDQSNLPSNRDTGIAFIAFWMVVGGLSARMAFFCICTANSAKYILFYRSGFVDFKMAVPRASVRYWKHCRLSQAVHTFINWKERLQTKNYDGVQCSIIDAKMKCAIFLGSKDSWRHSFCLRRFTHLLSDHSNAFRGSKLCWGLPCLVKCVMNLSDFIVHQAITVLDDVEPLRVFVQHALKCFERSVKGKLVLLELLM